MQIKTLNCIYRALLLCLIIPSWNSVAVAQEMPPRFEVTPFVGYRIGGTFDDSASDAQIDFDESASFGLALNMRAEPHTQYELTFSHQGTEFNLNSVNVMTTDLDVTIDYLQIGGTYMWDDDLARPFVVATMGLAHIDPDDSAFDSGTYFAFSIGGGLKFWSRKRFGLRLEGRFYGTVIDSDTSVFCSSGPGGSNCLIQTDAGIVWQFEIMAGPTWRF
jgi:hypothetical protein